MNYLHIMERNSICRQHKHLPWEADGEGRFIGRSESGAIYEQWVRVSDCNVRRWRRIHIVLKKATRDGDKVLTLMTNLSRTTAQFKKSEERKNRDQNVNTIRSSPMFQPPGLSRGSSSSSSAARMR